MAEFLYRRKLPHWRQDQSTYFVTWRLARGQQELGAGERDVVVSAIKYKRGSLVNVMSWPPTLCVHALLTPLDWHKLQAIVPSWKSFTAHQMQRKHRHLGRVWQDEYFNRIIRNDKEYLQKLD